MECMVKNDEVHVWLYPHIAERESAIIVPWLLIRRALILVRRPAGIISAVLQIRKQNWKR